MLLLFPDNEKSLQPKNISLTQQVIFKNVTSIVGKEGTCDTYLNKYLLNMKPYKNEENWCIINL